MKKVIYLGENKDRYEYQNYSELPLEKYNISIGNGCELGNRCKLGDGCELGDECELGNGCKLGDECELGDGCKLGNWCKIGNRCKLGDGCELGDWCELGDECKLGNGCSINKGFFIYTESLYRYKVFCYGNIIQLGCRVNTVEEWELKIKNNEFWTKELNGTCEQSKLRMRAYLLCKHFLESLKK